MHRRVVVFVLRLIVALSRFLASSVSLTLILIMWCTNFILVGGFHYSCSSSDSHSTKSCLINTPAQFSACINGCYCWCCCFRRCAKMHFKGQLSFMFPFDSLVFVMKHSFFFIIFCVDFSIQTRMHWTELRDGFFFVLTCKQMRLCVHSKHTTLKK